MSAVDPTRPCSWAGESARLLFDWLAVRLDAPALAWFVDKCKKLAEGHRNIVPAVFSVVPRYSGKDELNLTEQEIAAALALWSGWAPSHWSIDQVARCCLLMAICREERTASIMVGRLLEHAELREAVAIYRSLALLPYGRAHVSHAMEAVRSPALPIFDAVCLGNPYPAVHFDDDSWNRMVLKALHFGRPAERIVGFHQRLNPQLQELLGDFDRARGIHGETSRAATHRREEAPGDIGC